MDFQLYISEPKGPSTSAMAVTNFNISITLASTVILFQDLKKAILASVMAKVKFVTALLKLITVHIFASYVHVHAGIIMNQYAG